MEESPTNLSTPNVSESKTRKIAGLTPKEWLIGLVFSIGVLLIAAEYIAYEDSWTCRADNLEHIYSGLSNYRRNFPGPFLQSPEGIKTFIAAMNKGHEFQFCNVSGKPLTWFPKDIGASSGYRVFAMCPPDSHGWLRKFAWGLAEKNERIVWVRIKKNGEFTPAQ